MTTEREALFAAILANPQDDLIRLVAADWLQEHDEDDQAEMERSAACIAWAKAQPYNTGD